MRKIKFKKVQEKSLIKRLWWFVWHSTSIWSWIVDLVLLYIIIKFIFFPVAGFISGSSLPSVIVESESMQHVGNFERWLDEFGNWYEKYNISKQDIKRWPFINGIDKGDIIIVSGRWQNNLKVGEIIVFDANQPRPIIHRVIYFDDSIGTKGDNNVEQLSVEKNIATEKIIGKAIFRIPKAGWIKLIFVEAFKSLLKK